MFVPPPKNLSHSPSSRAVVACSGVANRSTCVRVEKCTTLNARRCRLQISMSPSMNAFAQLLRSPVIDALSSTTNTIGPPVRDSFCLRS